MFLSNRGQKRNFATATAAFAVSFAVTVTAIFSFGIVGVVRYDGRRRTGSGGLQYLALALFSALLVAAAVVGAIIVMAKK